MRGAGSMTVIGQRVEIAPGRSAPGETETARERTERIDGGRRDRDADGREITHGTEPRQLLAIERAQAVAEPHRHHAERAERAAASEPLPSSRQVRVHEIRRQPDAVLAAHPAQLQRFAMRVRQPMFGMRGRREFDGYTGRLHPQPHHLAVRAIDAVERLVAKLREHVAPERDVVRVEVARRAGAQRAREIHEIDRRQRDAEQVRRIARAPRHRDGCIAGFARKRREQVLEPVVGRPAIGIAEHDDVAAIRVDAIEPVVLRIVVAGARADLDEVDRAAGQRDDLRARIGRQPVVRDDPLRECRGRHGLLRQRRNEALQAIDGLREAGTAAQVVRFQHERGLRRHGVSRRARARRGFRDVRHPECLHRHARWHG